MPRFSVKVAPGVRVYGGGRRRRRSSGPSDGSGCSAPGVIIAIIIVVVALISPSPWFGGSNPPAVPRDSIGRAMGTHASLNYVARYQEKQARADVLRPVHILYSTCSLSQLHDQESSGTYACSLALDDMQLHIIRTFADPILCSASQAGPSGCQDGPGSSGGETDTPDHR